MSHPAEEQHNTSWSVSSNIRFFFSACSTVKWRNEKKTPFSFQMLTSHQPPSAPRGFCEPLVCLVRTNPLRSAMSVWKHVYVNYHFYPLVTKENWTRWCKHVASHTFSLGRHTFFAQSFFIYLDFYWMLLSQWKSKHCHCDQSQVLCKLLDKGEQLLL